MTQHSSRELPTSDVALGRSTSGAGQRTSGSAIGSLLPMPVRTMIAGTLDECNPDASAHRAAYSAR